jgi:hypothetical protein
MQMVIFVLWRLLFEAPLLKCWDVNLLIDGDKPQATAYPLKDKITQ